MCSRLQFVYANDESVQRFNLQVGCNGKDLFTEESNRYDYHFYPVITNVMRDRIQEDYTWGLIPSWAKDEAFRSNTFHARVETLHEKPTYKNILHQRCLVLASGYYEWRHEDPKGKKKVKHIVHSQDTEIFTLAGLWSHWIRPENGELVKTFTILTTDANVTMQYVANHNLRMPIMLKKEDEKRWLDGENHLNFAWPGYDSGLIAFPSK